MAVHCALGASRAECVKTLRHGVPPTPVRLRRGEFDPPLDVAFQPLAGTDDPFAPGRLQEGLREVLAQVMHEADLGPGERARMPVFVGSSCYNIHDNERTYAQTLAAHLPDAIPMPQIGMGVVAGLIRQMVGSQAIDRSWSTACSSAGNALLGALRHVQAGLAEHVLVVGLELANLTSLAGFSSLQLLGPQLMPFAADRRATLLGEGIGAIVLQAGAHGRLRVAGGHAAVDTHSITITRPDGLPIASVIRHALHDAGIAPEAVRAIKAHATGTPSNDESEARGLHRVFEPMPPVCTLKPWTGHTLGACGVVEWVLLASALEAGFLPGAPARKPDPALDMQALVEAGPAIPGHYLLNQFGFGGNNAVTVLELTC